MIDPTHDEINFIRMLVARGGEIRLQGNIKILKIDRLIPEHVKSASTDFGVFKLTGKGWQLARLIQRKFPRRDYPAEP